MKQTDKDKIIELLNISKPCGCSGWDWKRIRELDEAIKIIKNEPITNESET